MQKTLKIENGWLLNTKQVPSPHFNPRPYQDDISLLVIHYISLPPMNLVVILLTVFLQAR